jgi:hypothetical protein
MTTTTRSQVEGIADSLNEMLEARGSSARVRVEGRNGYTAVDLGTADGRTVKNLHAGTKTEAWQYIYAMREGLWLLEEPFRA